MFKRICVVGVGAIGGWMAARLAQLQGVQVSAVARGNTLVALQSGPLRLHSATGNLEASIQVSASPAELGPQDLVILAVKATGLASVAPTLAPLLRPDTVVYTAMNGVPWWYLQGFGGTYANTPLRSVDPDGAIAKALPSQHVLGGVVHASCSTDAPGVVRHAFGQGLLVGEPSGQSTARAQALHALLEQAGFDATLSTCIQRDIWYKLWGNMTVNPVSALTGATTDRIMSDPLVVDFLSAVMQEAKAIGQQLGVAIDQNPNDRHAMTRKLGAFTTSMLQDVQSQRPVELDALVASVYELGQITGQATPFTASLLGLARLQAQTLGLYPKGNG
ncbi:MAG: 2-dehydropantoate 2-reductase [Burkholderiaceae bacterium]